MSQQALFDSHERGQGCATIAMSASSTTRHEARSSGSASPSTRSDAGPLDAVAPARPVCRRVLRLLRSFHRPAPDPWCAAGGLGPGCGHGGHQNVRGLVGGPTQWHRVGGTASCRAGAQPSWRVLDHIAGLAGGVAGAEDLPALAAAYVLVMAVGRPPGRPGRRPPPSRRPRGGLSQFLCRFGTEFPYQIDTERGSVRSYW
jgi:hypothetical protein